MLKYNMSSRPFGFNVRNTNVSSTQDNFSPQPALTIRPTKVASKAGVVLDSYSYTVIEVLCFLYKKDLINKINGGKPEQIGIERMFDNRTGLIFALLDLEYLPNSKFTFDTPNFDKIPNSLENGVIFFPIAVISKDSNFQLNYGTLSGGHRNDYFAANLVNNHISIFESAYGGLIALPQN